MVSNKEQNNQVVVLINYDVGRFECAFRDGISEALFAQLSELNRIPGYGVDYGIDQFKGFDKSVVFVQYNKAKTAKQAAEIIKETLSRLGYCFILWKRMIDGACLQSTVLAEVFEKD